MIVMVTAMTQGSSVYNPATVIEYSVLREFPSPLFQQTPPSSSHRYGSPSAIQQCALEPDGLNDLIDKIVVARMRAVATGIARRNGSSFALI